ncbi:MAG: (Fe-S)-binding protein [Pseudomonadota bacterium]
MTQKNPLAIWQSTAEALSCGRTIDEQVESIRRYGNHGVPPVLRAGVLAAHGIEKPKATAEICLIFGCYRPFTTPFLLREYIRLLDILCVEYTYLDQEYCCGAPLVMLATEEHRSEMLATGSEFNRLNLDHARQKGAGTLAYCCVGCVSAARNTFHESLDQHVYIVDLILDRLETRRLKLEPMIIGYFAGCHSFIQSTYPKASLDWERYRQQISAIEGVTIVNLPNMCCKQSAEKIIEQAEEMKVDKILCACNWCHSALEQTVQERIPMIRLPELLLQSLES